MQNHTVNSSSQKLERAKEHLRESLLRLERLIQKQNEALSTSKKIRTQIISDLDSHIENLERILKSHH
ncbi:MAG: hypothetical protein K0R98_1144 [Rickettsiaceae bacterium]|jgi:hypothetical protein|nr:hypothetical protein [Rickettsiaceae bacterium]